MSDASQPAALARSPIAPDGPPAQQDGWEVGTRHSTAPLTLTDLTPLTKILICAPVDGAMAEALGVGFGRAARTRAAGADPALTIGSCPGEWLVLAEVHNNNLAVRGYFRGRGGGTALLEHVIQAGADRGADRATLEVRRSNVPARRLYERLGFEVAATRPNYYVSPPEDALILWRGALKTTR